MKVKKAILATVAICILSAGTAQAIPTLRLSSGGSSVEIQDGSSDDIIGQSGGVGYTGSIGAFFFNISVGITKPIIGSADSPFMDLFSLDVTGFFPGTLLVEFTDTDFTGPENATFLSGISGFTQGSVNFDTYYDPTNAAFGTAQSLVGDPDNDSASGWTFADGLFSGSVSSSIATVNPYSLTIATEITHSDWGTRVTGLNSFIKVSEPATLLLMGLGVVGFAFAARAQRLTAV